MGLPRAIALRKPTNTPKGVNNISKRGIRSEQTIQNRKHMKRNLARNKKCRQKCNAPEATAQETRWERSGGRNFVKLRLKRQIKAATLNVRGLIAAEKNTK